MNGGKSTGYTIIEVMLFLAISGFLFVTAAIFINGKQANVAFRQGINSANSQLNSFVNQVANGEYNTLNNTVSCNANIVGGQPIIAPGSTPQGASGGVNGCIFFGKVMQYDSGGQPSNYSVYTIVARQYAPNTQNPVASFSQALPVPASQLTNSGSLEQGLTINKMYLCSGAISNCGSHTQIWAFGIFGSFTAGNTTTSSSGAQSVVTAVIPESSPGAFYGYSQASAINAMSGGSYSLTSINSSDIIGGGNYILLCFKSGSRNGSITIGGTNGQQFTTAMQVGGYSAICN